MTRAKISPRSEPWTARRAAAGKPLFRYKTIPEGAATSVWADFVADADKVGGWYCENCHVADSVKGPLDPADEGLYGYAVDREQAKALWQKSEELVGERF